MRRYGSNQEVINAYLRGWSSEGTNGNGSLYFKGDVLYSYGEHFPLAVSIGRFYICNGDKYSTTTSTHQTLLFESIPNRMRVEIPFSALYSAGIAGDPDKPSYTVNRYDIDSIKEIKILDWEEDRYIDIGRVSKKTGEKIYQHVLGAVLFEHKGRKFLSGLDETGKGNGVYFLTQLADDTPTTVLEALESLKPAEVKQAEEEGLEVKRQGEFFFIPVNNDLNDYLNMLKKEGKAQKDYLIQGREGNAGHHIAQYGINFEGNQYVWGIIKHSRGDHRQVKLYETGTKPKDRMWYKVVENIQVASWSASGGID